MLSFFQSNNQCDWISNRNVTAYKSLNRKQYFNVTKTTLPIYNLTILDYMLVKDPITIRITNAFRIKVFDQLLPSLFSLTWGGIND